MSELILGLLIGGVIGSAIGAAGGVVICALMVASRDEKEERR